MWLSAGACKADLPKQVALDAGVDTPCSIFADQLVAFNPPGAEGGSDLGSKALGAPDADGVPLATNAVLTVAFLGLGAIEDDERPGINDLQVHGTYGPATSIAVYVGYGEDNMEFSGNLGASSDVIDFGTAQVSLVSYVQLVGLEGEATIDAFESLSTPCPADPTP